MAEHPGPAGFHAGGREEPQPLGQHPFGAEVDDGTIGGRIGLDRDHPGHVHVGEDVRHLPLSDDRHRSVGDERSGDACEFLVGRAGRQRCHGGDLALRRLDA
ncbi:MAG: hypothetical protein RIB98_01065 [Acidimicrobiales bacterium]